MFLLKLNIFLTFFLLTKQKLFWNFLSSNDTNVIDLNKFNTFDNSKSDNKFVSIILLSIGHIYLEYNLGPTCTDIIPTKTSNSSCDLQGIVSKTQFLWNSMNKDGLIFNSFDGCYTNNNTSGTLFVTNNKNIEFTKILNKTHFWRTLQTIKIECKSLCKNIIYEICYVEQTEDEKENIIKAYKMAGYDYDWMHPKEVQQETNSNWFSDHQHIIPIVFGVISTLILISFTIYKYIKNRVCVINPK